MIEFSQSSLKIDVFELFFQESIMNVIKNILIIWDIAFVSLYNRVHACILCNTHLR